MKLTSILYQQILDEATTCEIQEASVVLKHCDIMAGSWKSRARRNSHCYITADKHMSMTTHTHATIELWETVFSMGCMLSLYSEYT